MSIRKATNKAIECIGSGIIQSGEQCFRTKMTQRDYKNSQGKKKNWETVQEIDNINRNGNWDLREALKGPRKEKIEINRIRSENKEEEDTQSAR